MHQPDALRAGQGQPSLFYYDAWDLIEEHDLNAGLVTQYIHGVREDELLAKIDSYGTVYYHTDAEGSVVALTDTSGTVVERYNYDAFGAATVKDASETGASAQGAGLTDRFGKKFGHVLWPRVCEIDKLMPAART